MRSTRYHEFAAGKAVNNAKTIACLGSEVSLHCLCGAKEESLFETLPPGIKKNIVAVHGPTRRNLTIVDDQSELICHIQNNGFIATASDLAKIGESLLRQITPGDILLFSGSLPPGISFDDVSSFLHAASLRGALILADVDAVVLRQLDWDLIYLVKPNLEELRALVADDVVEINQIVAAAVESISCRFIVVSLGEAGAVWIDRDARTFLHGCLRINTPVQGDCVGCGDAMMGAFALALIHQQENSEALKFGLQAGFANLFCDEPGSLDLAKFQEAQEMEVVFDHGFF